VLSVLAGIEDTEGTDNAEEGIVKIINAIASNENLNKCLVM
jgi:hypothetical protein